MSEVNYETAWKFLKKIVWQFKKSQVCILQSSAENSSEHHQAKGEVFMADKILEDMECMEEGIADAMKGDEGDE